LLGGQPIPMGTVGSDFGPYREYFEGLGIDLTRVRVIDELFTPQAFITTDHDNSMPMGPDAQNVAFEPVRNNGRGHMPGMSFRPTGNHSNALVPLWAKGAGAE
ncbi:hypothetical protein ACW4FQ_30410, partial [Escherichia coli]